MKSVGATKILAAGKAIDEGKLLANAYKTFFGTHIDLIVATDSKDFFSTMSTCHNSVDRCICGDASVIRHENDTNKVNCVILIHGKHNLTNTLAKTNSILAKTLQLTSFSGELPVSIDNAEDRSAIPSAG